MLAWLTPLWLAGVLIYQLRMASGWVGTLRLRRRGVCEAPAAWNAKLSELAARLHVSRPVQLLESGWASVPVVVGHLRPAILVPAGLLAGMPADQIEAILLHELAHIRRRDYLVNLLQTAVEGLLFYHPAVWWISGLIRAEREHCCDDLAVAASTSRSPHHYSLALAALEQSRCQGESFPSHQTAALAATGGSLVNRIQRLLHPAPPPAPASAWAVTPVLVVLALASGMALRTNAAPQAAAESGAYEKWVNEDAAYVIEKAERAAFERLKTDDERKHFIHQFWLRRDPTPGTAKNEFMEEHYRRIAYSNQRFASSTNPGWKGDRGKFYILYGPPDEIEAHPSGRRGGPSSQQWLYHELKGIGKNVIVEFLDTSRNGEYRQTMDPAAKR